MTQNRKLVTTAVLVGAVVLVACCIIGIVAFWKPSESHHETAASDSSTPNLEETKFSIDATQEAPKQQAMDAQPSEPQWMYSTLSSVEAVCVDVHEAMSDECFRALDQFFLNSEIPEYSDWIIGIHLRQKVVGLAMDPKMEFVEHEIDLYERKFLPLEDSPRFNFIFGDPNGHKQKVLEVMETEECRVSEGAIRAELHDACHADSLMAYAMFLKVCDRYEHRHGISTNTSRNSYERELSWIEELQWDSFEEYHWARELVLTRSFRDAWVVRKCSSFDEDLFSTEGILGTGGEVVRSTGRDYQRNASQGESDGSLSSRVNRQSVRELVAIAVRLGHRWALSLYVLPRPEKDPNFWESLRSESPFVYHFYMYRSTATEVDKKERIKHAILAHAHAKSMNVPTMRDASGSFDPQLLQTHLSEVEPYSLEQLQEAYLELDVDLR